MPLIFFHENSWDFETVIISDLVHLIVKTQENITQRQGKIGLTFLPFKSQLKNALDEISH